MPRGIYTRTEEYKDYCRKKHHSEKTKEKISIIQRGSNNSHWKGGRTKNKKGYMLILQPNGEYIREHRLIMEKCLGIKLNSNEVVHHINGIKDDNRLENLKPMNLNEHTSLHEEIKKIK